MNLIVSFVACCFLNLAIAQSQTTSQVDIRLFAQCMFSVSTQLELDELTVEFYNSHSEIEMVRFDMNTQRAFIITTGISELSKSDFISWFEEYSGTVNCVQIGVYGIDVMNPYPFTDCQND